jgi:hypothetical protein
MGIKTGRFWECPTFVTPLQTADCLTLNSAADRIFPFKKFLRGLSGLRILRGSRNARTQFQRLTTDRKLLIGTIKRRTIKNLSAAAILFQKNLAAKKCRGENCS